MGHGGSVDLSSEREKTRGGGKDRVRREDEERQRFFIVGECEERQG
jgi:hypothetical protein